MGSQVWYVVQFEVLRTLKKPSFWILTLLLPIMIGSFGVLGSLGGQSAAQSTQIGEQETLNFVYEDQSGIIDPILAAKRGGKAVEDASAFHHQVIDETLDAAVTFPKDLLSGSTHIVAKERGLLANVAYHSFVNDLVHDSVAERIENKDLLAMFNGHVRSTIQTFKNGQPAGGFEDVIAPGVFLILFYFSIMLLGNQMVNATVEEKENRVTEIILTSMNPMKLLLGKVLGLLVLGAVQVLLLILAIMIGALALTLIFGGPPTVDSQPQDVVQAVEGLQLAGIPIDPLRTLLAFGLFTSAFIMTSGLLTMTGAMVGNAKDAGQVFGFVIMGLMLPYVALLLIVNDPSTLITQIMTWFPLTSPITVMIRNAVGNMSALEVALALVMQLAVGGLFFSIGARLFGAGALAYQGMSFAQARSTLLGR